MNILLFGVSNIGKTTIGRLLADKLNYMFYDIDEQVKNAFNITNEQFVNIGILELRDAKRCRILNNLVKATQDKIVAVTHCLI